MSVGVILLGGVLLGLATLVGLQLWMIRRSMALEGSDAPAVGGPLGDVIAGDALLFFHSPTCGPCRAMEPHVESLAARDPRVQSVDVTRNLEVARAFGIMATPTTLTVKGGKVASIRLGAMPAGALREMAASLR